MYQADRREFGDSRHWLRYLFDGSFSSERPSTRPLGIPLGFAGAAVVGAGMGNIVKRPFLGAVVGCGLLMAIFFYLPVVT